MTIKQFKKRWLMSKIEPELFYMPAKKKDENIIGRLIIEFIPYDTFDIDTEEFSNTRKRNIPAMIVIKNVKDEVVYKSEYYLNRVDILLPLGTYYVKVVKVRGYLLDEIFHEVIVDKNYITTREGSQLTIRLSFPIFQEKLTYIDEAPVKAWTNDNFSDEGYVYHEASLYLSQIEFSDKFTKGKLLSYTSANAFAYSGFNDKRYIKPCLKEKWKRDYWDIRTIADPSGQGVHFVKENTIITANKTPIYNAEINEDGNGYNEKINNCIVQHIQRDENAKRYDYTTGVFISESNSLTDEYSNYGCLPEINGLTTVDRVSYELNWYSSPLVYHPITNLDGLNKQFFSQGNFIVYKYGSSWDSITTWQDYEYYKERITNASEVEFVCLYDDDLQVAEGVDIYNFYNQPYAGYFNFISSKNTPYYTITNSNNYCIGYIKCDENSLYEQYRYLVGFNIEHRSEDYDLYFEEE